jgi:hypothetical protein
MPGYVVEHDLSWGLIETTVLQVRHGGDRFVVKAGGPTDRHIKRELRAHREFLGPWTAIGRAPRLVHGDADAKLVVTGYLPGRLVENDPTRLDPDTYRKAGELLRLLHAQPGVIDDAYHSREATASLAWLDRPNRIDPPTKERLRAEIASWTSDPVLLVPTHGVGAEPALGLAAQIAGLTRCSSSGRRGEARLAELHVELPLDGQRDVEPDDVEQLERAHRVATAGFIAVSMSSAVA